LEIGEAKFRYRLVPGWAQKNKAPFPIGNGKAIVEDSKGRLYFLNGSRKQCVIVLNRNGKVLDAWGDFAKSAHGLTLHEEGGREVLFIADNSADGKVFKTTLDGKVLMTVSCPVESGLYPDPKKFKPAEVITTRSGDFFVPDGYGSDYILRFDKNGEYQSAFGGNLGKGEARLAHWGPHGGIVDYQDPKAPVIILGLSDQQKIKRFTMGGKWIDTIPIPGGNPRDIIFHRGHIYIPHLGDDWPKERNNPGFVSVLNREFKIVANLGARPAKYVDGKLQQMHHNIHAFYHPHGICLASDGAMYVAQDASNATYPLKFVPIRGE
tara:strand:+ start:1899 stop:2864 length:966 start_codon:yes stop_codon:yes gene_type:complete